METMATSPLPKAATATSTKTMKFGEALMCVVEGKKITKLEWENKSIYGFMKETRLLLRTADGVDHGWFISEGDILGNDWVLL